MARTTVQEIKRISFLKARLHRLQLVARDEPDRLVPWIGAGFTRSSGYPTWAEFLNRLVTHRSLDPARQKAVRQLLADQRYDLAAEYLTEILEPGVLAAEMQDAYQQAPHDATRALCLEALGVTDIVTTNYDRSLEISLRHYTPLIHTDVANRTAYSHRIIKLHGTIQSPDSWTFTLSQYIRHYTEQLEQYLHYIFSEKTVLFVGCSLVRDMYLEILARTSLPKRTHYALVAVQSDDEAAARARELEPLGIEIIPYEPGPGGDYGFVTEILTEIAPSFEDMIKRITSQIDQGGRGLQDSQVLLDVLVHSELPPYRLRRLAEQLGRWAQAVISTSFRYATIDQVEYAADNAIKLAPQAASAALLAKITLLEKRSAPGQVVDEYRRQLDAFTSAGLATSGGPVRHLAPSRDARVRELYDAYRAGDIERCRSALNMIGHHGYPSGRLAVMRLKVAFLDTDGRQTALEDFESSADVTVADYGRALAHYYAKRYEKAVSALDHLERAWNSNRNVNPVKSALAFALLLRAQCEFAMDQDDLAVHAMRRVIELYSRWPVQARRLFVPGTSERENRRHVPSELSYEPRRFGSAEGWALVRFWASVVQPARRDDLLSPQADDVATALEATARVGTGEEDLFVSWLALVTRILSGSLRSGTIDERWSALVFSTRAKCPGLLIDVQRVLDVLVKGSHGADQLGSRLPEIAAIAERSIS
jgi:tetratricopeptide (TPR) repeat protein